MRMTTRLMWLQTLAATAALVVGLSSCGASTGTVLARVTNCPGVAHSVHLTLHVSKAGKVIKTERLSWPWKVQLHLPPGRYTLSSIDAIPARVDVQSGQTARGVVEYDHGC